MAPLPKPPDQRRRRNHGPQITYLAPEGMKGRLPKWPLATSTPDELELWNELWRTKPEHVIWAREHSHRLVARYVRVLLIAERASASKGTTSARAEARQLEDRLLISPQSKVRNRFAVRGDDAEVTPIGAVGPAMSPKERLAAAAATA